MPCVNCIICATQKYAKPNWLKKGWGKYCSLKCRYKGQKKGKYIACFICQKETYKTLKALTRSKSNKFFCNKSCQTIWRNSAFMGPKHGNWKGGESTYRNILIRSKIEKTCGLCQTKDKRILAVHHIDKNRKNNKINNLVWLCHNCHFLVHHYDDEQEKLMGTMV